MGREEGDDGLGVGGGDGGEEGGGVEGAGVEEVGGFCVDRNISNRGCSCKDRSENRDLRELVYVRRPDLRVLVLKERTLAERQDCRNAVCKRV
jgi:hypothetical protein